MGYREAKSLTINGRRYDSFTDRRAREDLEEKLPRPVMGAVAGQYLTVGEVGANGAVRQIRAVDAPVFSADAEQTAAAVYRWLDEHPDATTTVRDGAISTEKLADDAVTTEKLAGIVCTDDMIRWELCYDGANTMADRLYADGDSGIFAAHLERGRTYRILPDPAIAPVNRMPEAFYEENFDHGHYAAYGAQISAREIGEWGGYPVDDRISCGSLNTVVKALYAGGAITDQSGYDWSQSIGGGWFTMLQDVWLYRACLKPSEGMMISSARIFETGPGYAGAGGSLEDGGESLGIYQLNLENRMLADSMSETAGRMAIMARMENDRVYAAMSRDVPRDRSLRLVFIGGSMTYAASTAGLAHAFRKYVSMNLNAPQIAYCQSGVSVTTGSGSHDWMGKTGGEYNVGASGYAGLTQRLPRAENSLGAGYITEGADVVIVELGTADFWEGADLGSVSDLTDDTTFYGAVEKTITLLESRFPNARILWVLPFRNGRWMEPNSAGHTLVEYLIALKIICQMHRRVWVLDLFDRWYLNYDNESIRSRFFIDGLHITADAQKCVAEDMIDRIRQIIATVGLKRIEQPMWYSGSDSRYGTK